MFEDSGGFAFECVTSTVSVYENDGIRVDVLNASDTDQRTRVVVYLSTGGGAQKLTDTGELTLPPTFRWAMAYTTETSGEYWVRILVGSQYLIPDVSFVRFVDGRQTSFVRYLPGDFAVFKLKPTRQRRW